MAKFEFATVLINSKTKKAYNWYELRYIVQSNVAIKRLIENEKRDIIHQIICAKLGWSVVSKEDRFTLDVILDTMRDRDTTIIVPKTINNDFVFQIFIGTLIDLTNPYSSDREGNDKIVSKIIRESTVSD